MHNAKTGELAGAGWIGEDGLCRVMEVLGAERDEARFVGGAVRNTLLNEPFSDIDIATVHTPEIVIQRLEKAGIKTVPTGLKHGTVTAIDGQRHLEITTLRVDRNTDGRRADIDFTRDWTEDAKRRDFTMNALYAGLDGTVYDVLQGREDLEARRVRFIGEAAERIREDYLRILRFFRFAAHYGGGVLDEAGLRACVEEKAGLARLSGERVRMELLKILAAPDAVPVLRQMAASGILTEVFPEASRMERFEALAGIEDNHFFASDPVLRLGALIPSDEESIRALASRLRLSGKEKDRLVRMHTDETKIVCYLSMREVRRVLYRLDKEQFADRVMLAWAEDKKASNAVQWRALLSVADGWQRPVMALTGDMVLSAGVPDGPEVGRVMKEVEEWWVDADFIEDEFSLIERLKAIVQATVY